MSNINIIGKKKTNEALSLTNLANSGIYTPREVYNNARSGILFGNPNSLGYTYTSTTNYGTMYTYYQNGILKYVDTVYWPDDSGPGTYITQQFTVTTPASSFILTTSATSNNAVNLQLNGTNLTPGVISITPNVATTYSIVLVVGSGQANGSTVQLTF
jgi:hypothetical protein